MVRAARRLAAGLIRRGGIFDKPMQGEADDKKKGGYRGGGGKGGGSDGADVGPRVRAVTTHRLVPDSSGGQMGPISSKMQVPQSY